MAKPLLKPSGVPEPEQPLIFSPPKVKGRSRGVAYWAFWLNRISGVVLALYLLFHLGFLSTLYQGKEAYEAFLAVVTQPVAVIFDILLAAAAIYHGFNGVRVATVGIGIGTKRQTLWFWVAFGLGLVVLILMAIRMLGGE